MPCPACGSECREGAAFCDGCGARVGLTCGRCGTTLRTGARFCDACGAPVSPTSPPVADPRAYTPRHLVEKILTSRSAIVGERKQVTVLFADVKGSMDLAEQVDPEDWHAIMDGFFGILADGVHRYEGTVNQYTGDGIMALFGAPIAHEDHARRACLAALHLSDALRRYADDLRRTRGLSFAVRMGLNSGEVIVGAIGDDLRMDYTAQGHTVGLAARMEQLAEPGKVYVTQETAALVEGYFRLRDLGAFAVKGVRQPVRVLELEGIGALRTRLDVSRARGFSRFVGREDEMAVLEGALSAAADGRGQVVGVVAEAGVGKSRLCWEFLERCRARGLAVHQAQAVAHGRAVPYLVALELARSWFGVTAQDGEQAARKKIAGTLVLVDEDLRDALPLVCEFLGVADPERPAPRLEPEARSRRLLAVMKRVVHVQSRTAAVVVLVEDLHWMDGGSETFLDGVADAVPGSRTLLLVNFRPEYQRTHASTYQQVALHPLRPAATSALLEDLLGPDPALAGLAARLAEHTHGNPFFLEELVRGLVETGTLAGTRGAYRLAGPVEVTIPPSVQAVLAARIDRLGEREKAVLQTAAVIGKDVPAAVLSRVAEQAPGELETALHALTVAEFLYEVPGQGYSFAHPLTQEVAYRTQLAERRGRIHAAVARAIAALDGERLDERAALLAHHWAGAGDAVEAARWHRRAAIWVGARDFQEARHHWQEARRLLAGEPDTDETNALRVDATGGILTASARLGLDDAERAVLVAELEALARRIGDPGMRVTALAGPAGIRLMAGDPEGAIGPLQEAARLAVMTGERGAELAVHAMLALALFVAGRFPEAFEAVERTLAGPPADVQLGAQMFGFSPYLMALTFRGVLHRVMGRLDDSQRDLDRAGELARAHGQLEVQGYVAQGHSLVAHTRGDADAALAHARTALEMAERIDSPFSRTQAYEALGAAHTLGERWADARDAYERALAIMHETGTGFTDEAFYLAGLARTHLGAGDLAAARARAEEAVAAGERRHTRFAACTAYLILGEVLAAHDEPEAWNAAERALTTALALVVETGAATSERPSSTSSWLQSRAGAATPRRRGASSRPPAASSPPSAPQCAPRPWRMRPVDSRPAAGRSDGDAKETSMASTVHVATPEDDRRHLPGRDALPLWNESFWFPFYDPQQEIGVVFRLGAYPNRKEANLFLFITHRGAVVHGVVDLRAPLPPLEDGRLGMHGLQLEWERPLERFRIRYRSGAHAIDVAWEAVSPTWLYPHPPESTAEQVPRHLEQGGSVTGTVTIADRSYPIACLGHRDHSWGGERDWAKFWRWTYLSGEIGRDFWFNAVRIAFGPETTIHIGCLWDGTEVQALTHIALEVETTDGGTRQLGVDARLTDERGREHHLVGEEVLAIAPVQYGRTWLKDGFTRYRYGDRIGYGILEHGYVEDGTAP